MRGPRQRPPAGTHLQSGDHEAARAVVRDKQLEGGAEIAVDVRDEMLRGACELQRPHQYDMVAHCPLACGRRGLAKEEEAERVIAM